MSIKISNHPGFEKTTDGLIINTNKTEIEKYKHMKEICRQNRELREKMAKIDELLEKLNGTS